MEEGLVHKEVNQEDEMSASHAMKQLLQQTPSFWESAGTLSAAGGFFLYVLSNNRVDFVHVTPAAIVAIVLIGVLSWSKLFSTRVLQMEPTRFRFLIVGLILSLLPQLLMEKKLSGVGIGMLWLLYTFSALQAMRFRANVYIIYPMAAVLVSNAFLLEYGLLDWLVVPAVSLYCISLVWLNDWLAEV